MLVFLLSTLTGENLSINLYSKPVRNLKAEHLHELLISCIDKAQESGFSVVPIVFDRASANRKVVRKLLKVLNLTSGGKPVPIVELKLESYFMHIAKECSVLFCIAHILNTFETHCSERTIALNIQNCNYLWDLF